MIEKFKHWLIRKLGGHTCSVVTVSIDVPCETLRCNDSLVVSRKVREQVARELAKELIKDELCIIRRTDNLASACIRYKATIVVVPQERG